VVLRAVIDIHKHVFQAAVLDSGSGQVVEARFSADRSSLAGWAQEWRSRVSTVAIEATTGWRWVWRELAAFGFEVRLAEPVQARALLGRRRSAKTDRLDARWLARLLVKNMLPESWIPPEEIQRLRDRTRLRKTIVSFTVNGYHPQDEAFFSWFAQQTPSIGINHKYTYLGTFARPAPLC
jgi:transposase